MPPRGEAWNPVSSVRPSRPNQYGASVQCAEPVTGSSGIPAAGAKKREMKSAPGRAAGAVTIVPRVVIALSFSTSGRSPVTSSSAATTTMKSAGARPVQTGAVTPSASSNPGGGSCRTAGVAGKSSTIAAPSRRAASGPLAESKRIGSPAAARPVSNRTCELARVA